MDVKDTVAIVTGGANGIGKAICHKLAASGASHVVVADLDFERAQAVADSIQGSAMACNVAEETEVQQLIESTLKSHGRIDLFVANAGITAKGGAEVANEDWQRLWNVNLMSHVYAARLLLPYMAERGSGYWVSVASAAGLLTEIGSAAYSVTKHATVAFAEWMSVHYQRKGIGVSCVCPAGVATDFLNLDDPVHQFLHFSSVTPEQVAEDVLTAITEEKFLVLPHSEVGEYFAYKGEDYDKWIKNFSRLDQKIERFAKKQAEKKAA